MSSAGIELYNATDTVLSLKGYFLIFSQLETLIEKDSLKFFQLSDGTIDPYHHYFFTPVRKLYVEDFPVVVIIDSNGNNLYETGKENYLNQKSE